MKSPLNGVACCLHEPSTGFRQRTESHAPLGDVFGSPSKVVVLEPVIANQNKLYTSAFDVTNS